MARGRSGERVDRLIRVPDHAEAVPLAEPGIKQPLLQRVDVLVLVHDEVPVAGPQLVGHPTMLLDDRGGQQEQIVEVEHARVPLHRLVRVVETGDHIRGMRRLARCGSRGGRVVRRGEQRGLSPLDLAGEVPKLCPARCETQPAGGPRDQGDLAFHEPGQRNPRDLRPEVAELPQRGRVEGPGLHPGCAEYPQPATQLTRGPRGKGHSEDLAGRDCPRTDQKGDPMGDRPGLARTRAGQDADRADRGEYREPLLGIKCLDQCASVILHRPGVVVDHRISDTHVVDAHVVDARRHPRTDHRRDGSRPHRREATQPRRGYEDLFRHRHRKDCSC